MPYRMDVPEDRNPVEHIINHLGTPRLIDARRRLFKEMYDGLETTISPREREAMRFPLTVVVGCPVCNSVRMWRDWPGYSAEPIPEEFYENAAIRNLNWHGFTERERLLMRFVERFDTDIENLNNDDDFWTQIRGQFNDAEIGDVVILAGAWLASGRGLKALGIGMSCPIPTDTEALRRLREPESALADLKLA